MDVNYMHCGDHFTLCTNIKSLCCISETHMLYVNYTLIKNKEGNQFQCQSRNVIKNNQIEVFLLSAF